MNFSELKNFDIGQYFKEIVNKNSISKGPQAKLILWSILGALLLIAYIAFVFVPYLTERDQIQQKIAAIPEMEAKGKYLEVANKKAHDDLVQTEMSYIELNRLFSVESELEDLYQHLSQMATSQGLVISSLATDGQEAIYAGGKTLSPGQTNPSNASPQPTAPSAAGSAALPPQPLFYRIKLKIELTGNYSRYIRYRKLLAGFEKSVNFDKEQITLVSGDTHGLVHIKAQLSTYRLPEKLQTKVSVVPREIWLGMSGGSLRPSFNNRGMEFDAKSVDHSPWKWIRVAGIAKQSNEAALNKNEQLIVNNELTNGERPNERDPFSKSSSGMIEGGRDPRYSPLVMADPQSYVIMGVVVSSSVKAAMIRTDFRESYVVKVGDRLGNQGGVISDIDMDGIILRQPSGKIRLFIQSQGGQFPNMDPSKGVGGAR
jgi:Tfp pilus assembly protein PilO